MPNPIFSPPRARPVCSLLPVKLLRGTDPRRGHLQAHLAAFRQEDVHGLLGVFRKLALHSLDVFVRLRLEFGGGVSPSSFIIYFSALVRQRFEWYGKVG